MNRAYLTEEDLLDQYPQSIDASVQDLESLQLALSIVLTGKEYPSLEKWSKTISQAIKDAKFRARQLPFES